MVNTLRTRLLIWFISFSFLTVVVVISFNSAYFRSRERVNKGIAELNNLQTRFLLDFKVVHSFFALDISNSEYFQSRISENLKTHYLNFGLLRKEINRLSSLKTSNSLDVVTLYQDVTLRMAEYEAILKQLTDLINERGFKDEGDVGKMRDFAHQLETYVEVNQTVLLTLRRHEKDYIIRNEKQYIDALRKLANKTRSDISNSHSIPSYKKDTILNLLDNYLYHFNKVVMLDDNIGIRSSIGLKKQLDEKEADILTSLDKIITTANLSKSKIFQEMEFYYIVFFILIFILGITVSSLISKRITSPLSTLTNHIQQLITSDFRLDETPVFKKAHREIEVLYAEFLKMITQLEVRDRQRDEAEKALRLNELKYRQLAEMLPQSVFETNEMGNFSYVNKTWLETFGYDPEDIKEGLNLLEVVKSETLSTVIGGKEFSFKEFIALRKDGTTFPAVVYSNPRFLNRDIVGYTGIIIDNTERKSYIAALEREKKKAEESDKLKSAFLANMSHEIRTPMNSIIGFTSLLSRNKNLDQEQQEYLRYITQSGDLLMNLIDDIIDFAKIEAGELAIRKQDCNLNRIMEDLKVRFSAILREREKAHIYLELVMSVKNPDFIIRTDPHRLTQVLSNLLSNAVKFTEHGKIEFGYEVVLPGKILYYVKDSGIGIDKKDQKVIFERFRQLDGSLMRKYGGTGLGLSISKHLVELMGGRIKVESEPNKGTIFRIEMPLETGTQIPSEFEIAEEDFIPGNWKGKTIMIAEDNNTNFTFLKESLRNTGLRILHARNGQEALDFVKKYPKIECVLMDMQMPVMDGYTATRQIKKIRPDLTVIAQTAYALAGEREKALDAGCDDYLSKPLNINILKSKISYFFMQSNSRHLAV